MQKSPARAVSASRPARTRLSREEKKAERAQALLDAAWNVFCEIGYDRLTIEDVADRAGYSRQPVYTLFGDKQNLFIELQARATRQVLDLLVTSLRPGAGLRENLTRIAQIVAEQLNSDKPQHGERLFFVAQSISLHRPDLAEKIRAQAQWVIDEIARLIQRSPLARGEVLRNPPPVIAAHIAAQINGMTTVHYQTGRRYVTAGELTKVFLFFALARD